MSTPTATAEQVEQVERIVLDLFAGPGGWDEGARQVGLRPLGVEWDADACRTRRAAGHWTVRADVSRFHLRDFRLWGLLASPPCQAWSLAGKRLGILDQPRIFDHLAACAAGWVDYDRDGWHDDRSPLVLEPLRFVDHYRPSWVALEQVPGVLPFWEAAARWMQARGYRTSTAVLSADMYGVPQTRQRAILVASRTGPARLPVPTHRAYRAPDHGEDMFGVELPAPVSMAAALGWGATDVWAWVYRSTPMPNSAVRHMDEPAPTVMRGHETPRWVQTNNDSTLGGGRTERYTRSTDRPSPTVTTSVKSWKWYDQRPATTVQGDPRIGRPGHKDRAGGEAQFAQDSVRVTVTEAALLQTFPADYPWCGSSTAKFRQIGDAVPPLLAAHVLAALLGPDGSAA